MSTLIKIVVWVCFIIAAIFGCLTLFQVGAQGDYQTCLKMPNDLLISTTKILSLTDNGGVAGTFIFGSGSVRTSPVFVAYIQNPDGSFQLITFPTEQSKVYQDQISGGYVEEHELYGCMLVGTISVRPRTTQYLIHIPKDSIIKQFKLDGEF